MVPFVVGAVKNASGSDLVIVCLDEVFVWIDFGVMYGLLVILVPGNER